MRKILILFLFFCPLTSFSKAFEPRDRYEEIEPCKDYTEPFLECRTNLELYFRSCKRKSGQKFISCLFLRAGGLMTKDPLSYLPRKTDPKGITAIQEYRNSQDYKDRLSVLEDDLRYFEDFTFCIKLKGSRFRWKYDDHKRELRYSTRLFPISKGKKKFVLLNVPASDKALHFTATPKLAKYFMRRRTSRTVIFFRFTKRVVDGALEISATHIAFCKGRKCNPEFSVDSTGEVYKER